MCFMKPIVRVGVIAGLVGGTAVLVAGPERVQALVVQTRDSIKQSIDEHIDDPVALRAQLRQLEAEYPKRIAEVRSDLTQIERQLGELQRERKVSARVVELADADLEQIQSLIARGESAQAGAAGQIVRVRFEGVGMDLDGAYAKANSINQLRSAYATQASDIDRDLGYLSQQRDRLGEILTQLETERAEYQAQLWQLDRQVDAIARNDRMIDLLGKRQKTLDKYDRYEAHSLGQVQTKLADIRAKQEAELDSLARGQNGNSYERRAKYELESRTAGGLLEPVEIEPDVIEIELDDECENEDDDLIAHRF